MALPFRPYLPRRFINQKLHPNLQKMFKHRQCETHRGRPAVEVQHGSSPQAISEASPKSDKIFKHLKCEPHRTGSSNTKTLLAQPLFIQQKLHANRAKVFEHLQCEAHRTISAVELQHGSSHTKTQPHGLPHQKPHPNRPRMFQHLQCEAHRSRSAVEIQAISPTPLHPKAASSKSDTNVRAASMPKSPDQLGHSDSASPPDHIEPILTEAPSPYLLHLHSRAITGEIHPRERTKRNLFQTTMCTLPYAIVAPIMVPHRSRTDRGRRVIESPSGKEMHKEK